MVLLEAFQGVVSPDEKKKYAMHALLTAGLPGFPPEDFSFSSSNALET
jgi:hypothetical protein